MGFGGEAVLRFKKDSLRGLLSQYLQHRLILKADMFYPCGRGSHS